MNLSIPKISVGKSNQLRKSLFDFKNCDSTSFNFGVLQPLFCKQIEPRTHISLLCHNFVRFAAMHSPTFGSVSYRTYKSFVPCTDIWEPYDDFKAMTPYNNGDTSYVPEVEPNIRVCDLSKLLLMNTTVFSIYGVDVVYDDGTFDVTDALDAVTAESVYDDVLESSGMFTFMERTICNFSKTGDNYHFFRTGDDAVTIEGADFIIEYKGDGDTSYIVCFKLGWYGQNLFKTLIGCGFQVNFRDTSRISLLPFIAYYKAYYDLFFVQRNSNWNNTSCAQLMRYLANHPEHCSLSDTFPSDKRYMVFGVQSELMQTYYSCDPDFVSAHVRNLASDQPDITMPYIADSTNGDGVIEHVQFVDNDHNVMINNDGDDTLSGLSRVGLQLLNKLAVRINKNTAFGRRLDLILKNLFGARYHHAYRTNFIGSQVTDCQIGDIMSSADTASDNGGARLGEFAGKGIGRSNPDAKPDHFTADTWGHVIVMACIVPDSGYCQALDADMLRITKDEQFQSEFDAVGYEATPKSAIFGDYGVCIFDPSDDNYADLSSTFGFIPRFTSKKIVTNKVNGMLALRSTRKSYLGYTLDRFLTPPDILLASADASGVYKKDMGVTKSLIAGVAWRYISRFGVTTNFNRIFYNTTEHNDDRENIVELGIFDNFIVHNFINVKCDAPMLSISDSFDTDAFESDTMDIEKA